MLNPLFFIIINRYPKRYVKIDQMQISIQGKRHSFSHQAAKTFHERADISPCETVTGAIERLRSNQVEYAIIPFINTLAGPVPALWAILPECQDLWIEQEIILPIRHMLYGQKNAAIGGIAYAHSHPHALTQCHDYLTTHQITPVEETDTAGSVDIIAKMEDPAHAAIAPWRAIEHLPVNIICIDTNIQDDSDNTTRFFVFRKRNDPHSREPIENGDKVIALITTKILHQLFDQSIPIDWMAGYPDKTMKAGQYLADISASDPDTVMKILDTCAHSRILGRCQRNMT